MATHRGFVQSIEIKRVGLASITLVHADASTGTYVIRDLDGDPERFNERLSQLAVLRDAMNRAEPVEIEHSRVEQGEEITRAVRITRDALAPLGALQTMSGIVVDVVVLSQNGIAGTNEMHDQATVTLLADDLTTSTAILDLQAPERLVASDQLAMLREAQAGAQVARLVVSMSGHEQGHIVSVALGEGYDGFGRGETAQLSGFVETLGLIKDFPGESATFAHVRFTTAPDFTGPGNVVSTAPYTPQLVDLLVPRNALAYELFEAGLRDKLRMRVSVVKIAARAPTTGANDAPAAVAVAGGTPNEAGLHKSFERSAGQPSVVFGAELVAPLASASRPVWITIERESLDCEPERETFAEGVPSSDLAVQTLTDLRIPYGAEWKGLGCFNHGVYRFQFALDSEFAVAVDGRALQVHASDDPHVKFAYACLGGDHVVTIRLERWACDKEFAMDVYRLR